MEYTALTRIKWDGQIHEPGDAIAPPDAIARTLLEMGKIAPAATAPKTPKPETPKPETPKPETPKGRRAAP